MSAKLDQTTLVEVQRVQTASTASSSASSATSTKMSMFKGKAGFVIPKNKFSGSLVPIFKGVKKSESNDATSEESSKQLQRKTKWGPDLTQDTAVRRGRALAYQTRVDQITQQLESGSSRGDSQNSKSARDVPDSELPTKQIEFEKLQSLELERREAIGELLKLNASYKAPSDYQPIMREATVPIPVKAHPEYNFLGLVYGSDGETQKKLEKETGTRIQVYGTKSETGEKVEITPSDGSEIISYCEEVYVRISSDTYEKVDAAATLIELLLSSVPVKSTVPEASASVTGVNAQASSEGQDMATAHADTTTMASTELQSVTGPITTSQSPFQQYPSSWFPAGQSNLPSGLAAVPSSVPLSFNPSPTRPLFGAGSPASYRFGSIPQSTAGLTPRLHTPGPVMQGSIVPPVYPLGQAGPPRNLSAATSPSPLVGKLPTVGGPLRVPAPQLAERPLTSPANHPGWALSPAGAPQSLTSSSFRPIGSSLGSVVSQSLAASPAPLSVPPVTPPQFPSSQVGPASAVSFVPSQLRSSSPMQVQSFRPQALLHNSSTNVLRPIQNPMPPLSAHGTPNAPSFTPLKPIGAAAAPRPLVSGSSDFTFQPHRPQGPPSQSLSGPGVNFVSHRPAPVQLPPAPQVPSFRPALQSTIPQPVRQNFPRLPVGNHVGPHPGQFGPPGPNPHAGPRNLGPVPQIPNAAGPFPPRVGHSAQYQQSYPASPLSRPGGVFPGNQHSSHSGRPQVYDPFSPTSLPAAQPQSNIGIARKQESDPEYEDLMASVGVK